ncbi:hypothetical protein [Halobaculum lipolyticum]|uniref:Uncharacterized protein n=1 Tax=Halobaculum lipolyticum TaxID=3032001 RepID=A0ABD5W888_9EURY|nr:hypothetical protein [Halobaculum sp. DT31]
MIRNRAMKKVMGRLKDMGMIGNLTSIMASAEHEVLTAAKRLEDAQGGDTLGDVPPVEMRKESLEALIDALVAGEVDELWRENVAPELLDTTDGVEKYRAMEDDDWEAQIERWADSYREGGAEGSDRALAAHHVTGKWGVSLATFEERVVNWNRGTVAERLFASNFRAACDVMHRTADELEAAADE